jgi:HlyD family secretion protein
MKPKTAKRLITVSITLAALAAAVFAVKSQAFASLLTVAGISRPTADAEAITVAPRAMSFYVEAAGLLSATSVQNYGGPPAFGQYWQFQLVSLAPEGRNVKQGDTLVVFDQQKIMVDLQQQQNELGQATKELEKTQAQIDLERQELAARLADAENKHEKLKLKQRMKSDIEVSRDIELDDLAVEQARREVELLKDRLEWHRKSSEATVNIIASKKARAENKVKQIQQGLAHYTAKADRDGVVVYKLKWNGEKFQLGENVWSGQPVLEIPDLKTIIAEAFVPEVDIGKVKAGQRVEITIDAFPGKFYTGRVKSVGTLVKPKAWDIPNKVLDVQIALDQLDTAVMRPAMSLKTKIETGAIADCLAVPIKAVRTTAEGAKVKVRAGAGWEERSVKLGESNGADVVIVEGLRAGERIAADFTKAR